MSFMDRVDDIKKETESTNLDDRTLDQLKKYRNKYQEELNDDD